MNQFGNRIKLSIFGESHGAAIGVVMDGIPSGMKLDIEAIRREMLRRAPGRDAASTPRKEADEVQIVSGYTNGFTTGTPLCAMIANTDTRSADYHPELLRPGHADYTAYVKYGETRDYRGGGHFSGRITAPLVFAGAVCKQILQEKDIFVGAHLYAVAGVSDTPFDSVNLTVEQLALAANRDFPVMDEEQGKLMQEQILQHKQGQNSVGGMVECGIIGVPAGLGSPFFESVESRMSAMMFSIPAVKGVEFGDGFAMASMTGKDANDSFCVQNGKIRTVTNHNGGINGGISNGMPILFRVAVKPTPTIGMEQQTVNIETMENTTACFGGRHDACIAQRAVSVVEAGAAIVLADLLLSEQG